RLQTSVIVMNYNSWMTTEGAVEYRGQVAQFSFHGPGIRYSRAPDKNPLPHNPNTPVLMKIGIRLTGPATKQPFADVCKWCASIGIQSVDTDAVDKDKLAAAKT